MIACLWWLFAWGCGPDVGFPTCAVDDAIPTRDDVPTWQGEIRALTELRCNGCHGEGGVGPMPFETFEEAAPWAPVIAAVTADRTMPPWPPVDCCRPLQHPLALTADEIGAFAAWADGGAPEGDPADYVAPDLPARGLPHVDLTLAMPEAYTPDPRDGTTDDTRCFLVDWPEDDVRYVTGLGLTPGTPEQVHHALLLVAGPLAVPSLQLLDRASPGPGWSCPGGVVWGATGWIGGWSPGWEARQLPAGTGQKVAPGSKLVLTVHYSLTDPPGRPDLTTLDLMLADQVQSQLDALSVYDPAWLVGGMKIPADDPDVMVSFRTHPHKEKVLVGANLHMHERGSHGSVGIEHADGSRECLLQIDRWDHDWQGDYLFEQPVPLAKDDALWVECHWDNTAANQREIDGVAEAPHDLAWAEDEEMCVAFVSARDP
ncbi:MAG: cytochrome c [Myxococcota bacterium]